MNGTWSRRAALTAALVCAACGSDPKGEEGNLTSNHAQFLEFAFKGEVWTAAGEAGTDARKAIVAQLFYATGPLTFQRANARVGFVEIQGEPTIDDVDGMKRIRYEAKLPVAWPKGLAVPSKYEVIVPLHVDDASLRTFNAKYDGKCGTNQYGQESFWHDFLPSADGCQLASEDVLRAQATVKKHPLETKDKFPEYDRVWADKAFQTVAVFAVDGSNSESDLGVQAYQEFLGAIREALPGAKESNGSESPSIFKDTTLSKTVEVGGEQRQVSLTALLITSPESADTDFDTRYDALTKDADLLMYNGHSGLSKNIRALVRKGTITKEHYQLFLLNGCNTFAYLDTAITDRRKEVNGAGDPNGTKYLDAINNVLPGYFNNLSSMSAGVFKALLDRDNPVSYNELLEDFPESHIVVVVGEDDNEFSRP